MEKGQERAIVFTNKQLNNNHMHNHKQTFILGMTTGLPSSVSATGNMDSATRRWFCLQLK